MTRVLLAMAHVQPRRMLRDWIAAESTTVLESDSAIHALDLVEAHGAPAAAFCDLQLHDHDGVWLAEELRDTWPQTAVVMTTATHDLQSAVRSLQSGVVDYLVAPFTRERVTEALRRALHAHEARRALADARREAENWRARFTEAVAQLELSATSSLEALLAARRPDLAGLEKARRVARIAVNLALTLQIGEPHLTDIERAVLLHDAGRRPEPDERQTLAILGHVPLLSGAIAIALAAHERGTDTPVGARIIAVASAYDELVSGRPGGALTAGDAVEVLCRERSSDLDPKVLDALRTLQPSGTGAGAELI
jgi:response regulator RpfG family c-di-GMP phosphodiesterase